MIGTGTKLVRNEFEYSSLLIVSKKVERKSHNIK